MRKIRLHAERVGPEPGQCVDVEQSADSLTFTVAAVGSVPADGGATE